jgi:hypothetical protein
MVVVHAGAQAAFPAIAPIAILVERAFAKYVRITLFSIPATFPKE